MKIPIHFIILIFLFNSCNNQKQFEPNSTPKDSTDTPMNSEHKFGDQKLSFERILEYPLIKDTAKFIEELKDNSGFTEVNSITPLKNQSITYYKKIKLLGSKKEFILLEYDYKVGSGVEFPWKTQFVFSNQGKLIKYFNAIRFELVNIFPAEYPLLMIVFSTYKGNGGHEFYKFSTDTLENVFHGFSDYFPRTYDAHADHNINEPYELILKIRDDNKDGFNDIIYSGNIIHNKLSNGIDDKANNKLIPVKFTFLFNKSTGHFVEKEVYSKKYIYLD